MGSFGSFDITYVTEGHLKLDGGAMYGVVPKTLWQRSTNADVKNRIDLATHVLVVRRDERLILVDTGSGDKWDEKSRDMYGIEPCEGGLTGALARKGIAPEDVTDVIYTHLHFDHAGGGTEHDENGAVRRTFPRATYHVQRAHWEWANAPTERDGASFMEENLAPLAADGALNLIEGSSELFPGVFVDPGDTHTVGHQTVRFTSEGRTLFHCGDLIPMSYHVRLPFIMAYDLFPLGTLETKRNVLEKAIQEDWTLFFEHDPARAAAKIVSGKRGPDVGERVEL